MSLPILFTPEAEETLQATASFIETQWGSKTADRFLSEMGKTLKLISEYPFLFKATTIRQNVRQGIISKHTSVVYEVTESSIIVLYFWDNCQKPILS